MPPTPQSSASAKSSTSPPLGTSYSSAATIVRPDQSGHREERIPFTKLYVYGSLISDDELVTPDIQASIEKNVFLQDEHWTCYRRNYITVSCHYTLAGCSPESTIYLDHHNDSSIPRVQVQAFGVCLSATQDRPGGKTVGLIGHTAKRDRGPQLEVTIVKLPPASPNVHPDSSMSHFQSSNPGPHLPLQNDRSSSGRDENGNPIRPSSSANHPSQPLNTHYQFERIQFKQATANNGRRRATQQFYHLNVELHAQIKRPQTGELTWVKVGERVSEAMVVRGRSPGHYKPRSHDGSSGASGGAGHGPRRLLLPLPRRCQRRWCPPRFRRGVVLR